MLFHGARPFSSRDREPKHQRNPRDKLQILTLAKRIIPGETAWFTKQYEEALWRPFGYLFVDLEPTTEDSCRLRTNVLPGEERFEQGEVQDNVSQALLQYRKPPITHEMQRLENNMDNYCIVQVLETTPRLR